MKVRIITGFLVALFALAVVAAPTYAAQKCKPTSYCCPNGSLCWPE